MLQYVLRTENRLRKQAHDKAMAVWLQHVDSGEFLLAEKKPEGILISTPDGVELVSRKDWLVRSQSLLQKYEKQIAFRPEEPEYI